MVADPTRSRRTPLVFFFPDSDPPGLETLDSEAGSVPAATPEGARRMEKEAGEMAVRGGGTRRRGRGQKHILSTEGKRKMLAGKAMPQE